MYRVWSTLTMLPLKTGFLVWLWTLIMKTNSWITPELFTAGKKQAEKMAEDNQNFETFETRW